MLLQYIFLSGGCSEIFIDTANALCCLQIGLKKTQQKQTTTYRATKPSNNNTPQLFRLRTIS